MSLLTNFAGPVCLIPSPTEQTGFKIVFAVAAVLLLVSFINLKLYSVVLRKWFRKSASVFWQRALLLSAGVLTSAVILGFLTGTSDTAGYCKDGVWEGLQIPLMWVALVTTALIAIFASILGLLFILKLGIVVYKKVKNRS
jgi:ABC-type phosphate/phosphonate transport system permease subunit